MDARPTLISVARSLREQGLESILIGNAAAALWGAPLTTLDLDFLFRKTPGNLKKLKAVARSLSAVILKPYYPVSDLFRVVRDDDSLQLDFMAVIHGIRSYNALRSRVTKIDLGGEQILVAALSDIIASKRAANRARDRAVLDVLQKTLEEQEVAARRKIEGSQNRK
jgi:predicted nucleotidyltransferase